MTHLKENCEGDAIMPQISLDITPSAKSEDVFAGKLTGTNSSRSFDKIDKAQIAIGK